MGSSDRSLEMICHAKRYHKRQNNKWKKWKIYTGPSKGDLYMIGSDLHTQ
jgi:hypothetical protein